MKTLFALAALAFLTPSAAFAGMFDNQRFKPCDNVPPLSARAQPTVDFRIDRLDTGTIMEACNLKSEKYPNGVLYGCTFQTAAGWQIFLNNDMDAREAACVLLYEKAHLPPNSWQDPVMESMVEAAH
jgi:hypothetical protein